MNVYCADAGFALDVATPVELAVAALLQRGLQRVVASTTAHQVAAVHTRRGTIARATTRAE